MLTPMDLCQVKPALRGHDAALETFLARSYDHETQTRSGAGLDGMIVVSFESDTVFDGERR